MSNTVTNSASGDELERLRAQLLLSEVRLAEAQRIGRIGLWEWNLETDSGWWSPEMRSMFGGEPDDPPLTYASFLSRLPAAEAERVRRAMRAMIAHAVSLDIEYQIVRPDGTLRFVHGRGEVVARSNGVTLRMAGTVEDVTERVRLARALFESEARCRSVFEHLPFGVAVLDRDGRYLITNSAWSRMTGYSPEELAQMYALDLTHPEDWGATLEVRAKSNAGTLQEYAINKRYVHKDGEVFWARVVGATLRDEAGAVSGRVAIIEDITEQRQTELRRAQRRRVHRDALVRDVHHRIKNHLQGVSGLLERHASANPALAAVIDDVLGQMNALAMVHGLQSEANGHEVNLCNIARAIVESLRPAVTVPLVLTLPEAFAPVEVNAEEAVPIALVLNELVANALKHLAPSAGPAGVELELKRDGERATVVVRNQPARLPPGFDLSNAATLGIGLRLVRSLLLVEGAQLSICQSAADVVESTLELGPPAIHATAGERRHVVAR